MTVTPFDFTSLRGDAKLILEEFNTGTVLIKRRTSSIQSPTSAWDSNAAADTYATYTLDAAVFGVSQEYVDDTVSGDDLNVITSPLATLNGTEVEVVPVMGDELSIDGVIHRIKKIERIPAAGLAVAYMIFVAH